MIASVSIKLILNIIFLGFFCRRINKLDKLASEGKGRRTRVVWGKIILIVMVLFAAVLEICLAFGDSGFWM